MFCSLRGGCGYSVTCSSSLSSSRHLLMHQSNPQQQEKGHVTIRVSVRANMQQYVELINHRHTFRHMSFIIVPVDSDIHIGGPVDLFLSHWLLHFLVASTYKSITSTTFSLAMVVCLSFSIHVHVWDWGVACDSSEHSTLVLNSALWLCTVA